ncbi:MAG: hypothetical protein COT81_04310 [Candidatus Buchananbacteria bacterium CG10_big_fil_rev_8_21_14_0_10_42_9]|uniref:Glycoside hydrolase family 57 N-terminal domain-containing protein n=1 Tax=Candidatus Buchananbacteria bacterium CG10_big_fil_rev_8_21_14_0_10_42_9 TaxID=1974526 RepID=A0A2H0W0G6_9BACT|nr:MAG: hypothetical protein COT81_04310 [Candidatus Buchananbacteria bacterium CG10_big_fil_rev_8_21_14_0_10_42_9]
MYWANFLHLHQPPNQTRDVLRQLVKESYQFIIKTLNKSSQAKLTVNISGSLVELLVNYKFNKVLEGFIELAKQDKIELTGTAKYHPILPLLPSEEIARQIKLNDKTLQTYFESAYQPKGFYLPEMAYSKEAAKVIADHGFEWILLDEISYNGKLGAVDFDQKYQIKNIGLTVVFRNRNWSKSFPPTTVIDLNKQELPPRFVVTATDGEMYGYWHKDDWKAWPYALGLPNVKSISMSQLIRLYKNSEKITPVKSNWESTEDELKRNHHFAQWDDPHNLVQVKLNELRELAIKLVSKHERDSNHDWARRHLDRGLCSCAWWWAAGRQLDAFSPVSWNPDEIEKGLQELIKSVRSLKGASPYEKIKAEKLYHSIITLVWQRHWEKQS